MSRAQRQAQFAEADLYVVISEDFCAGRDPVQVLEQCLAAGVRLVQFREKAGHDDERYERLCVFREKTREAGALLMVDDRVDLALAAGADGVHLGQHDLPLAVARQLAPDLLLGLSTHSPAQAVAAQQAGADVINIGPIFFTRTKQATASPLGPEVIRDVRRAVHLPFSCMGGIKLHNLPQVLEAGARIVAVVTAVTAADDVREAATVLRRRILEGRRPA